jgi:hypothetical protein
MNDPILGDLTDLYNGLHAPQRLWQGKTQTKVFSKPLLVHFKGTNDLGLTPPLQQALETFLEQQEHYKQIALEALLEFYRKDILPLWKENDYFGVPELAPDVHTTSAFETLLSYPRLFLHDGASWGLEFECTWDVEHGTGVRFKDGNVVDAGLAEVAFRHD